MNEVQKLILKSKLSQKDLAARVGTTPERLSEYKNGKHEITVAKLKAWCLILKINIKTLF